MKYVILIILTAMLSACSAHDKYDGLIVTDGMGRKYQLKHNIMDTYFIKDIQQDSVKGYVAEANAKVQ